MTLYNVAAASISLFFVVLMIVLIRRQRLGIIYTLWWLLAIVGMLSLGFFPAIADWAGQLLGIHYPPVLPIILALCLLFVKILTMDMAATRQEMRIRILAQKMAAYETELQHLKGDANETPSKEKSSQT